MKCKVRFFLEKIKIAFYHFLQLEATCSILKPIEIYDGLVAENLKNRKKAGFVTIMSTKPRKMRKSTIVQIVLVN